MKQRILERAWSTVDAFLRKQCADINDALRSINRFFATPAKVRRDFALQVLTKVRADA